MGGPAGGIQDRRGIGGYRARAPMGQARAFPMRPAVALRLGRVSNLPTVWTNVLAGMVLSGHAVADWRLAGTLVAVSLAYVGGMYLNDAFDAEVDALERPHRPIPSGEASRNAVFAIGLALLATHILLLAVVGYVPAGGTGSPPVLAGLALAAAIVIYDRWHKANPLSTVVMGLCRVLVYVIAGYSVADTLPEALWFGAAMLLCHLIGLSYAARQETLARVENLWPLVLLAVPLMYGMW